MTATPPPNPYAPAPVAVPPTNLLAILSLVGAFIFPVAGVVLGILAKGQIRRTGEGGDTLATVGIVLSIALTVLGVVIIIVVAIIAIVTGQFLSNLSDSGNIL
jgi:heme/copper-type cytochrome/quinol oxidase subunit 2